MLYPQMSESREVISLDGIWDFQMDNGRGFSEKWYEKKLPEPMAMPVPSSYQDLRESRELREHKGYVFYQKEFYVTQRMLTQRLMLRFGSVTHQAKVYLNGNLLCEHKGGFLPFEARLNGFAWAGSNRLTVAVDNRVDDTTLPMGWPSGKTKDGAPDFSPNFDFFNYAGIMRPVKLYTTPEDYIEDISIDAGVDGEVRYQIKTCGGGKELVFVQDRDGQILAWGQDGSLKIDKPVLWEPGRPYLYTMTVTFGNDVYRQLFGVRSVEVKDGRFLLNGKPFYFKGFGKHEDSPILGRGFSDAVNVKDLSLMKWMGANSFRTSHYPYSEELMSLCDRMGVVVIDEVPAVGLHLGMHAGTMDLPSGRNTWDAVRTAEQHRQALKEMVARDKNHPCVVMWSIANESATEEPGAHEYFEPLFRLVRELDPQHRPATMPLQGRSVPETCLTSDLCDVIALNRYYGWYTESGDLDAAAAKLDAELSVWEKKYPDKPIIMTEYGADTVAGIHDTVPEMFSEEFQEAYLEAYHRVFDRHGNFVGEQVWNFADFATPQGLIRVQGNKKGVFTRDRKPKAAAWLLKKRWENLPDFQDKKGV